MKYIKQKILLLVLFLYLIPVYGQEHSLGAILDPVRYEQIKTKPLLITRNYTSDLPSSFSIRQYSPKPEDQDPYPTCVGWATTFAARTISESVAINRTDSQQITSNAFSPYYTYRSSKKPPVNFFRQGMQIYDALDFLKEKGAVRRRPEERVLPWPNMPLSLYANEKHFPILDYVTLYKYNNPDYSGLTPDQKVLPVKKSLFEKHPVIIAFEVYSSFYNAKGIWEPFRGQSIEGYHAMCVIGYDDDMDGGNGAFLIQNSWGDDWGNEGLIWVRYRDFAQYAYEAYELIENENNYRENTILSASIEIEVQNDTKGMPMVFDKQGFYKTRSSYPTGTLFRFLMTNHSRAYVYAFSTDTNNADLVRIFPRTGDSELFNYSVSTIAWPSEREYLRISGAPGTDYLVVLFSTTALSNIDAIERRFVNEKGAFPERVSRAVGSNFIPYNVVNYDSDKIKFSTVSINPNAVVGLLLAIEHR